MKLPGDRIQLTPLVISDSEPDKKLERVLLTSRSFQEDWMQNIIHSYPSLLPVDDIEPVFGPLVSLGREIPVDRGYIDNLFISPQGYLTIVETKLWRNPEARREVVGQIIEYAKEVSTWTFDELNQKVKDYYKSTTNKSIGVIDALKTIETICEENESKIIDAIMRNIKRGRFLLLIVGDGIRESTEELADYLSQTPQLHFTLALVELQVYKMDKGWLVLPQIVMRTKEITRAIIRVEGDSVVQLSVDTDVTPEVNPEKRKRYTLSEDDFFDQLKLHVGTEAVKFAERLMDAAKDLGCDIQMRQSSYVIIFADPSGSGQRLTLLVVSVKGELYTGWLIDQLDEIGLPIAIGEEYLRQIKNILSGCETGNKKNVWKLDQAKSEFIPLISAIANALTAVKEAAENI